MAAAQSLVLELRGITKRFPGVVANDGIDLDLRRGEVHALLGENGAGKSTMMKVLAGIYKKDAGRILYQGKEVDISSPRAAQNLGIIDLQQDGSRYFNLHHTPDDTLSMIDKAQLRQNVAAWTAVLSELANYEGDLTVAPKP